MSTYVLVHGAWHGAWSWDKVTALLEAKGHKVVTFDLPGHGEDKTPVVGQDLFSYAKFIQKVVEEQDEPVILAGHSLGGMMISQTAEWIPEKIKKLVYVCAFLPSNGQSADGETAFRVTNWAKMAEMGKVTMTEDGKVVAMNKDFAINGCFNDLPIEMAEKAYSLLCPEAVASQYQNAELTDRFDTVPRVYIRCLIDNSVPLELQDRMIAAKPCEAVFDLNTGHSPFWSDPEGLADILDKVQ